MSNKIFPTDTVAKSPLVAADLFLIADSADSNKVKDITGTVLNTFVRGAGGSIVMATGNTIGIASGGNITFTDATVDLISLLGAAVKVGNGTPTQTQAAEDLYVEGKLEIDGILYADSNIYISGNIDWSAGNVWYVPTGADIQAYITAAASGDTLILGSGDYTIIAEQTIPKNISLNFIGQGIGKTNIICATDDIRMFVQTSNDAAATFLRFEGMTLQHTGNGTKIEGIFSENSSATYYTRVDIKDVEILMTTSAEMHGIRLYRGGYLGKVDGLTIIGTSTLTAAPSFSGAGINVQFRSTYTGNISSYWTNVYVDVTTARADALSIGVYFYDHSSTGSQTLYMKDCFFKSRNTDVTYNSAAFYANGDGAIVTADRCSFDGDDADVYQAASASVTLRACIKANNLTTGTISHAGTNTNYGINVVGGILQMGSSTVNAGVFSMIQGAVASDPTFTITQSGNNVAIAQTVGSMNLTAVGEVVINDASGDVNFRIESDANANMFFMDAGDSEIGIGGIPAGYLLKITGTKDFAIEDTAAYDASPDATIHMRGTYKADGTTADFVNLIGAKENATVDDYASYFAIKTRINGGALTERLRLSSAGVFTLTQNSDTLSITLDGTDAYMKWSDGDLYLMTDEGTNTLSKVVIKGKGTGSAQLYLIDGSANATFIIGQDDLTVGFYGTAGGAFRFNEDSIDCDFVVESDGNASMFVVDAGLNAVGIGGAAISGFALAVDGTIVPITDNTYYLGKNDDDSPLAWKGVIVKDTTNGKYYRVEVISGVLTATDLTD